MTTDTMPRDPVLTVVPNPPEPDGPPPILPDTEPGPAQPPPIEPPVRPDPVANSRSCPLAGSAASA